MARRPTGLLAGACMAVVLPAAAEAVWLDFPLAPATARNTVGHLGVGLLVQRFAGPRYGPVAVALLPVVCALVGLGPGGRPHLWTWPLHLSESVLAAATALLLLLIGVTLLGSTGRSSSASQPQLVVAGHDVGDARAKA